MNSQHDDVQRANCYVALELSRNEWLVSALLSGNKKVTTVSVDGGDTDDLLVALNGITAKKHDLMYSLRGC